MKFDNFIFDFDGTLADTKKCGEIATQKAFEDMNLKVPDATEITYYMGIPIEESFIKMAHRSLSNEELNQLMTVFRQKYKDLEQHYIYEFAGITEALTSLCHKHKKIFVVSSKKSEVLERNLSAIGVQHLITEAIGSDQVTNYKPDPEGLNHIVQTYNLINCHTIYIGDTIFDIKMAQNAGISSAAVTWGSHQAKDLLHANPDYIINDPSEIITVLS
ncbi:HAD family hydrolase [Staphylococcus simiae]|uniref:HAD family hydrolase n=1 Tax=Staphylococcus simiae TaxID=308354 RepID=UPI001A95962E|nr:HAD family hydrolase [Staphylococcus simiae]MBO1199256.1 HAD family hydrolase [Staphylococcus simiae]MBO1201456.1 HAD family hydrolase [Staphylococcus simiae]MBO1203575.1 HAD family hydrolase [Staphylococcus simiae]MBO1211227.1 HAD family hydrolase [Staphylococcus simiae]MBO1229809.1 HAD family hydrolase [Staphylococcus simiae]